MLSADADRCLCRCLLSGGTHFKLFIVNVDYLSDSALQADGLDCKDVNKRCEDSPKSWGYLASRSSTENLEQTVRDFIKANMGASAEAGLPAEMFPDSVIGTPEKESKGSAGPSSTATSPSSGRCWAFHNLDQKVEEELDTVSPIAALLFLCVISERSSLRRN